ncbi:DUF1206 domain-containing protein [Luteipulveratus sp. YIM 133296]|uniref:DUF1206 domain-containing protein n=2 Tax=Luteipulveratus flavus TaxID=3031728 RepID=A0ABT6CFE4_9MICO|nr:DUF1206 domain-containing protein [Luteipulveratus sp. YIM 133296]MDF8266006.1 DUF1206 domain-containing protein [Luteipulveratus sp. YIM 133296]
MNTADVQTAAHKAGNSWVVENGARVGYAMSGLLHLLIAYIALKVAWTAGGGSADQSGALATLANSTGGPFVLWLAVVGFVLLAVWQLTEAVSGAHGAEASDRAKNVGKMVVYAVLAWTALTFATGSSTSSEGQTKDFTAGLMQQTGGRVLVGAIGLGVIGVAGYHVYKGWKKKFLEDLREHPGSWAVHAGRFGYIAKGAALAVVGALFLVAAVHKAPSEATGLDGGLRTLREAPAGSILLTLVALGLAAYGIYSFARARYARV